MFKSTGNNFGAPEISFKDYQSEHKIILITKDTSSTLENPYAKSEATVTNGYLKHSLETKPTKHPVKVEKEIVYRDRTVTQTVEVPAQFSKWQNFKMKTGGITLTLLTIAIVTAALYLLLKTKNFFKL